MSTQEINDTGTLKTLIDPTISIEKKGAQGISVKNITKFWFATNSFPVIKSPDDAVYRRLVIIEFPNRVEIKDKNFIDRFTEEECERIISMLVSRINTATFPINEDEVRSRVNADVNVVENFVRECCTKDSEVQCYQKELYSEFVTYCARKRVEPVSKKSFTTQLMKLGDIEPARDDAGYIYVGVMPTGDE
jgi:putative DNA primase/helicase